MNSDSRTERSSGAYESNPGRSMLSNANLPPKFWTEALSTAAYLRNRSPTKVVRGMTPQKAWTGAKPQVDHLRVFGCRAFVHVPKDERKKLGSKSKKCILLGYGTTTKGYHLYDPLKKRVLFSRDVIFNDCKYVFEESTQQESQKRVYLDYFDELSETAQ